MSKAPPPPRHMSTDPVVSFETSLEAATGTGRYEWRVGEDRLTWTDGLLSIYGLTSAPAGEGGFSELIHPDDRVRVEAETSGFLSSEATAYSHTFRIVRADGAVRSVLDRGVIERDENGRALIIRGINIDITELGELHLGAGAKVDEAAIHQFAELEALYAEAPLGLGLIDRDLCFVRINSALAEMNGYPVEAHINKSVWDLAPDLRQSAEPALVQVLETGLPLRDVRVVGETPAQPGVVREWREHFYPLRGGDGLVQGIGIVCEEITERVAIERALAESEARLAAALRAGRVGVHDYDVRTNLIQWDETVRDIWGVPADEVITFDTFAAAVHPEDLAAMQTALQAALEPNGKGRYEATYRVLHRESRRLRWVRADGDVTFEDGEAVRLIGTVKDITERKRIEAALALSERRFKLALAGSPITVFEHDEDLRYEWLYNSKLGYSDTFCLGKTDAEIMAPETSAPLMALKRRVLETGQAARCEVAAAAPGGPVGYFDLHVHPRRDEANRVIGLTCVSTDVSDKKHTELALRDSEAMFRAMADDAPMMVWVTEPDGACSFLSASWYEYTGQTREEALGFGWLNAVHPDDAEQSRRMFAEANADQRSFRLDYRLRRADGAYRWAIDSARPRFDAQGQFLGFIGSVIDIAERKLAEDALRGAHDAFRQLVEHSPFGIYAVDADFRLVQVSDGAQKVFENVRPLLGRDFADVLRVIWPEPFASEAIGRFRHTLETGEPYRAPSTIEQRADIKATESYDWKIERVNMPDGRLGVVCHFYDLTERRAHEEKIEYLMREVNHRAKNMLSLIDVVAKQTAAAGPEGFLDRFSARLRALGASQDLLVQTQWSGADLAQLIESQLLHFKDLVGHRISLSGPPR